MPTTFEIPLPAGLDQAVLRLLSNHVGRANPISRLELVSGLRNYRISERQLREQIRQLRRIGYLIGSAPGRDGGYYMITSPDEFQEFLRTEYQAKIDDMRITVNAMTKTASRRWGEESIQLKMF